MCLLTFFPSDVDPDCQALYNGTDRNGDGHGFAIVSGDRLITRRGMSAVDMIDTFTKLRRKHRSGPALFHSRLNTGGANSRGNCHPFRVRGDHRTVVAHNGVLRMIKQAPDDQRADTRVLANEFLPKAFGNLNVRANRDKLAKWVTPQNKLVILTVNPAYNRSAYLINGSSGVWDDGIWYSNHDYVSVDPDPRDLAVDRCVICGESGLINAALGVCETCGLCLDCGLPWDLGCQCFTPVYARTVGDDYDRWRWGD